MSFVSYNVLNKYFLGTSLLFIVTPIVGVCNCSMFCCTLLYVHSSIAIILMETRELVALLNLSSWCLVMVERLFLAVPRGCLRFVIVVFPDHTTLLFLCKYEVICSLDKTYTNRIVDGNVSITSKQSWFYAKQYVYVEGICKAL